MSSDPLPEMSEKSRTVYAALNQVIQALAQNPQEDLLCEVFSHFAAKDVAQFGGFITLLRDLADCLDAARAIAVVHAKMRTPSPRVQDFFAKFLAGPPRPSVVATPPAKPAEIAVPTTPSPPAAVATQPVVTPKPPPAPQPQPALAPRPEVSHNPPTGGIVKVTPAAPPASPPKATPATSIVTARDETYGRHHRRLAPTEPSPVIANAGLALRKRDEDDEDANDYDGPPNPGPKELPKPLPKGSATLKHQKNLAIFLRKNGPTNFTKLFDTVGVPKGSAGGLMNTGWFEVNHEKKWTLSNLGFQQMRVADEPDETRLLA